MKIHAEDHENGRRLDLFLSGNLVQLLFQGLVGNGDYRKLLTVVTGRRVADRFINKIQLFRFDRLAFVTPDRPALQQTFLNTFHIFRNLIFLAFRIVTQQTGYRFQPT